MTLPPHKQAEAQILMDSIARRFLAERLDSEARGSLTGEDQHSFNGNEDGRALLRKRQPVPIAGDVGRVRGREAA